MTIHLPKINGVGGGNGGGGSAKFPTIVTSSGSSLPSASGFEWQDTFLNTSDKKIYMTTTNSYELNTNVTRYHSGYTNDVSVDSLTGIATGFALTYINGSAYYKALYRTNFDNNSYGWKGEKDYKIHFKTPNTLSSDNYLRIVLIIKSGNTSSSGYGDSPYTLIYLKNKKLYFALGKKTYSGTLTLTEEDILAFDYEFEPSKEYYLDIQKKNNGTVISVLHENSYEGNVLAQATSSVPDNCGDYTSTILYYGSITFVQYQGTDTQYHNLSSFGGDIYLLDSTGEFLKASSELSWDSGVEIEDKNEYADKTNGILYLYENDELVAINTPSSFSSITGNATDNTSLATALSGKRDKAETITISTASVTIANVQANKNYVLSSSAITDITLTACETSFEETSINFTTGNSAPTFTDNASIKWFGGVPEMKANTTYTIVIFNKQAYWQEQENV